MTDHAPSAADVPYALLLVPVDGDPLGLLAQGPCGARQPVAIPVLCECRELWVAAPEGSCPECHRPYLHRCRPLGQCPKTHGLALIWGGMPVPDGIDRAARCFEAYLGAGPWHRSYPATRATAVNLAHNLCDPDHANAATMVRLDAQGQEMVVGVISTTRFSVTTDPED